MIAGVFRFRVGVAAAIVLGLWLGLYPSATAEVIPVDGALLRQSITAQADYWIDTSGNATIDTVAMGVSSLPFVPCGNDLINLGLLNHPVWLRFTVSSGDSPQRLVVDCMNSRMTRVDFYVPAPGGIFHRFAGGQAVPVYERAFERPNPAFPLNLAANTTTTCFIRVENSGVTRLALRLWDAQAFQEKLTREPMMYVLAMGIILAVAVSHLVIYLALRERGYLYLTIFEAFFLLYYLSLTGYGAVLLWPNATFLSARMSSVLAFLTLAAGLMFTYALLEGSKRIPRWSRVLLIMAVLSATGAVLRALTDHIAVVYFLFSLGLIAPPLALYTAYRAGQAGYRPARMFLVSWGAVICASFLISLDGLRAVPIAFHYEPFFVVLFTAGVYIWSFTLTDRVKIRERESRELLENEVARRTAELRAAIQEVKTLSGLLPICSHCKSIRDDKGYWKHVETYLQAHTGADFSHSICPDCVEKYYPEFAASKSRQPTPAPRRIE